MSVFHYFFFVYVLLPSSETESSRDTADQAAAYEEDDENGDWIFLRSHRPRTQQNSEAPLQNKLKYQSPGRNNWNSGKP